jgi:secreted Zn-dependent insulinase-like peptidase
MEKSELQPGQCLKLKEGHVYDLEAKNTSAKSKNSGSLVVHQIGSDASYYDNAVAHVLASILHEPAFATLRTQEKLGYTVKLSKESIFNVNHISIFVQSSKFDPLYVESRINAFLSAQMAKMEEGLKTGATKNSVESNKKSILNDLKNKPPNLKEWAQSDW